MTTMALQRVVVRMLYDPAFTERVYVDPATATADLGLSPESTFWLTVPDKRAYGVDEMRRARSVAAMIEEYAVSMTLVVHMVGRAKATEAFDSYFSSDRFHADMQAGESLGLSFGMWMAEGIASEEKDIVEFEIAMARARRAHEAGWKDQTATPVTIKDATTIRLNDGVLALQVSTAVLPSFSTILEVLRSDARGLHAAVLDEDLIIPRPIFASTTQGILIDGHDGELKIETTSFELAQLLSFATEPLSFAEFVSKAAVVEASREDCLSVVESFAADAILLLGEHASR